MQSERNALNDRPHVAAVRRRLDAGEQVTEAEMQLAVAADVNLDDLRSLAGRLAASRIAHHVYRSIRGDLVVYPESYEAAFADAGSPLERVA
jgi:hypothetical protein